MTPEDRIKVAFAEGYLEGNTRKSPERFLAWIKALQSFISFSIILTFIIFTSYKCKLHFYVFELKTLEVKSV